MSDNKALPEAIVDLKEESNKERVFVFKAHTFPDPGAEFSDEEVVEMIASYVPELAGATSKREEKGGELIVTLSPTPKRLG